MLRKTTLLWIFIFSLLPQLAWTQGKSAALLPYRAAGKVTKAKVDKVFDQTNEAIAGFGYTLVPFKEVQARLGNDNPTIDALCEAQDNPCYARLADLIGVNHLFFGVVERVGKKLAVDLSHFVRRRGSKDDPGSVVKQHTDFYVNEKSEPLASVVGRITGKLLSQAGYLKISTNADGASIFINGKRRGTYPLKEPLRLPKGSYTVVLKKKGYSDYSDSVEINVEETTTLKGALKPNAFVLNVDSEPAGAAVYLGETNLGYTPIRDYQILTFGELPLKLSLDRYFEYQESVEVLPGEALTKQVRLKPQFGDVLVVSEALDVKVYLDGEFVGNTPLDVLPKVSMGKHEIKMEHPDYLPFTQMVEVAPATSNKFNLSPTAKYAKLRVTTNVDRARVTIGDKFIGFSPVDDFVRLKPGRYKALVTKFNYFDYKGSVVLRAGKSITLTAKLKTKLGTLNLTSNVRGAKVYLNDRYLGETPLKPVKDISFGKYRLLLVKKPFFDYEATVNIKPGRENSHFAEMITTLGKLKIESSVKGAQVFLGKKFLGTTPAPVFERLKPGDYTLRVTKEGYEPYSRKITIVSNKVAERKIKLKRLAANLRVTSTPSGSSVYLDGSLIGVTPLKVKRETGTYALEVRSKGYRKYQAKISLDAKRATAINAKLAPKPFQLYVYTSERQAKVTLDGVLIGTTPVIGYKGSKFGERTLRIRKEGFKTVTRKATFNPGKRYKVTIKLKPVS